MGGYSTSDAGLGSANGTNSSDFPYDEAESDSASASGSFDDAGSDNDDAESGSLDWSFDGSFDESSDTGRRLQGSLDSTTVTCAAVACPAHSTGANVPTGCVCDFGYMPAPVPLFRSADPDVLNARESILILQSHHVPVVTAATAAAGVVPTSALATHDIASFVGGDDRIDSAATMKFTLVLTDVRFYLKLVEYMQVDNDHGFQAWVNASHSSTGEWRVGPNIVEVPERDFIYRGHVGLDWSNHRRIALYLNLRNLTEHAESVTILNLRLERGAGSHAPGSQPFANSWDGWYSSNSTFTVADTPCAVGKRAAYNTLPLTGLRLQDDSGQFAEYNLTANFTGRTLLSIVTGCIGSDGTSDDDESAAWAGGRCEDVGTLVSSSIAAATESGSFDEADSGSGSFDGSSFTGRRAANLRIGVASAYSAISGLGCGRDRTCNSTRLMYQSCTGPNDLEAAALDWTLFAHAHVNAGVSAIIGITTNAIFASTLSPYYTGGCERTPCPHGSDGTDILAGDCTCDAGFTGAIGGPTAVSPFYTGGCSGVQCTSVHVLNSDKSMAAAISGVVGDVVAVQCEPGYASSGYTVAGSTTQPSINGVYHSNGDAVFANGDGSRVLYWQPGDGGKWVIADAVGTGFRASEARGASPAGADNGPRGSWHNWFTYLPTAYTDSWRAEPSVTVTHGGAGSGTAQCLPDATASTAFTEVDCSAVPCPARSSGTDVPTGDCICDDGYTGVIAAAASAPFFTGACRFPCLSTEVPNSDKRAVGSITGVTGERQQPPCILLLKFRWLTVLGPLTPAPAGDLVVIECLPGYASSEAAAECLPDGTFTSVVCSAISCPAHSTGTVRPGKPHTW